MALAIDASTIALTYGSSVTTLTTGSMTPPDTSLLLAVAGFASTGAVTPVMTLSNSGAALTWNFVVKQDQSTGTLDSGVHIYYALLATSRALTVTLTPSNTGKAFDEYLGLKVYILTGQHATVPIGATGAGESTTNNLTPTVFNSTADNSWTFGGATDASESGAPTSTDTEESYHTAFALSGLTVAKAAATPTSGSGVTLNFDGFGTGAVQWNWAAVEILPVAGGGGGGIAIPVLTRQYRQRWA